MRRPHARRSALPLKLAEGDVLQVGAVPAGAQLEQLALTFHHHYLSQQEGFLMLKYAIVFALISLVAGALGFGGIAAGSAGIAKILFGLFLILAVIFVVLAALGVGAVNKALK